VSKTELEETMALHIRANDLPEPVREYRFHPKRLWRFDFAWPAVKLALEVEGGIYMKKSGHNTAAGITRDCFKGNEALCLGWRVIRVTSAQIDDGSAVDWLRKALEAVGA
jgi:very-short-patch-repair endonuclease